MMERVNSTQQQKVPCLLVFFLLGGMFIADSRSRCDAFGDRKLAGQGETGQVVWIREGNRGWAE